MNGLLSGRLKSPNPSKEIFAGVTTAVVSLPMAVAFGVASGAGAQAGIYGAVLVGFFAAIFGGTNTLISEPTGPMTVLIAAVVVRMTSRYPEYGLAMVFTVVMVAGIVQILFGVFKLGKYFTMMPYSVISGFMSGIGLLLVFNQLPVLLGADSSASTVYDALSSIPGLIAAPSPAEWLIGFFALAILFLTPRRLARKIPPQLVALVLGSLGAIILFPAGDVRSIGEIGIGLPKLVVPHIRPSELVQILIDGTILGVLGAIDSSLTAMIADSLTREHHDSNRELIGQGVGNIASGLFGGLPGAGATMGTVVNIQSGARSPMAAIIRSLVLVLFVFVLAPVIGHVPRVVLAAIAVRVGFNILDWSFLGRAHKISRTATLIMYAVMILTVFVDLLVAVAVGVFIANIITIERLSGHPATRVRTIDPSGDPVVVSADEQRILEQAEGGIILFHLSGPMIFGVAQAIAREASAMDENADVLLVDLTEVSFLSTTVALGLENLINETLAEGKTVIISGASPEVREKLKRTGLKHANLDFYQSRMDALNRGLEASGKMSQAGNSCT
ncbi:SulP family inorganic anion transporter [Salinispira pacifica]|uniref:Sulfate permease n=1 Tax=Salinispira pacifica TaxID=1307761 RepID=V5WJF6_9SPIO|nr:SulP family inorganic anion transporter [Salinispira pacifica]AHC15908.1 Sulfate permease [Salinispira pacifica]